MGSSVNCTEALNELFSNKTETTLQALDAFGKVPAGVLIGNSAWWGGFDQCLSLDSFKYCLVSLQLNGSALIPSLILRPNYGVCVPDVCTEEYIVDNINILMAKPALSWITVGGKGTASSVHCQEFPQKPYDAGFICFTILCLFILMLMLAGTIFDIFQKYREKTVSVMQNVTSHSLSYKSFSGVDACTTAEKMAAESVDETKPLLTQEMKNGMEKSDNVATPAQDTSSSSVHNKPGIFQQILLCFAFNRNVRKLLDTSQSDRTIGCLNGIRVISISWVMLGHIFIFAMPVADNTFTELFSLVPGFSFQSVANAFLSVDTFFFMSGFLISLMTLLRLQKWNGKLHFGLFYFHRLWRLVPLYAFVVMFAIFYQPYLGSGPSWFLVLNQSNSCAKNWWTNLLFINNFYQINELCLSWSWYLANDMQFFIITPLILLPIFRSKLLGLIVLVCLLLTSFIVTAALIGYYDLLTNLYGVFNIAAYLPGSGNSGASFFGDVYIKPYCRISPYLVGIAIGYFVYRQLEEKRKIRLSPGIVAAGWALASAIGLVVVYGTYGSYHNGGWSTVENVFYGTFSRFAWSAALSWVLIACHYGYGGWINDFLSWSFWIPLGRLTYSVYLVHGVVITVFYGSFHTPVHCSLPIFSFYFAGCFAISYGAAVLFSLAIEYPFANLEKMFLLREFKSVTKSPPPPSSAETISTSTA